MIRRHLPSALAMLMGRTLPGPSEVEQQKLGAGQIIYILDEPVAEVNELAGRVTMGPNPTGAPPGDHGTGVACLAAGEQHGLAVGARIVSVPLVASMTTAQVRAQLNWILGEEQARPGCAVVNISQAPQPEFDAELTALVAAGCVLICAAGNSGQPGLTWPASRPDVLAVAGCDQNGVKIDASRWDIFGRQRQVFARGNNVETTAAGGGNQAMSGTSPAAPQVAGLAAMWCEIAGWYGDALHIVDAIARNATPGIVTAPFGTNLRLAYAGWRLTKPWSDDGYADANPDVRANWGRLMLEHYTEYGGATEGRGFIEDAG